MLRPNSSHIEPNHNGSTPTHPEFHDGIFDENSAGKGSVDIEQELNLLEEIILSGLHVPFTRNTLVDEDKLLDQLDFIRLSLPKALQQATEILRQKEEIILQAQEYGQQVVEAAQAKRAQILDNNEIIKQAEREASELRRKVQQECEAMMQETLEEIDRKRRQCQQELEEMRQAAIAQAQVIQRGADEYADRVLENIEEQLQNILRIIHNGRQQLQQELPPQRNS
jgi:cell division septum initiation protein DivIVA